MFLAGALLKLSQEMGDSYNWLSARTEEQEKSLYGKEIFQKFTDPRDTIKKVDHFKAQRDKAFYLSFQAKEVAAQLWPLD